MTLRSQLVLFVSGGVLAATALTAGVLWLLERRYLRDAAEDKARLIEESVVKAAEDALLLEDPLALVSYLRFLARQWPPLVHAKVVWTVEGREREAVVGSPRPGTESRVRAVAGPLGGPAARLEIGLDRPLLESDLRAAAGRLGRQAAALVGVLLAVGGALSAFWAVRLTRPLRILSEGAEAIGRGQVGVRLEHHSSDELGQLVRSFDRMSVQLAELEQMKKDFVSGVTHELRSPVAATVSLLNALLAGKVPEDRREDYLARAKAGLERLGRSIDNLLDAARIEQGRMEFKPAEVPLSRAVSEVLAMFEAGAVERGVGLAADVGDRTVKVDPEAFQRVLVNLVSNAIKFTPAGGQVRLEARGEGAGVVLSVADSGAGIPSDELEKVFEKFVRGREARGTKGTGLGLYLVKQVVEAHGGRVEVRSAPGQGSTFTLHLPS